ncbi:hypothetical protein HDV06_003209 [Boothiomyces sp. JEL0866]|nr:hypothetical protein HDV06_003209 [Boothiomyces sp. JEL0866]
MEECPIEISLLILQYLSHQDIVSLCGVNNHWFKMQSDDRLWRIKCEEFKFPYNKNTAYQDFQENYVKYRHCISEYKDMRVTTTRLKSWLDRNGLKNIIKTLLPPAPYEILDGIDMQSSLGQLCMFYHLFSRGQANGPGLFGSYLVYNDFNTILLASIKTVNNFTFFGKSVLGRPSYLLQTSLAEPNYDSTFLYASGHSFFNQGDFKSFINKYVEDLENGRFNVEEGCISRFPNYGPTTAVGEICSGLRVSCSSIPSLDSPELVYYYRISIEFFPELSKYKTCQLKKRDWLLTFKSGKQETVSGEGVIGKFPKFSGKLRYPFGVAVSVDASSRVFTISNTCLHGGLFARYLSTIYRKQIQFLQISMFKNQKAADVYKKISSIPIYSGITQSKETANSLFITATLAGKDFTRASKISSIQNITYDFSAKKATIGFPSEVPESNGLSSISPSGNLQAILKTIGEERYVEIAGTTRKSIKVTKSHGPFYNDDYFGCINWSEDGSKVVYVAEESKPTEDNQYEYLYDPGEGYTGKRTATAVVVDLLTDNVTVLKLPFFGISQPLFAANALYFVGVELQPVQLGIKYCANRYTALYKSNLDGSDLKRLTKDGVNAKYPLLTPDGKSLVYLSNPTLGPHDSCCQLLSLDIETETESVVVPYVDEAKVEFNGLFALRLKPNCWIKYENHTILLVNATQKCRNVILAVDISTKTVMNLTLGLESWNLFGTTPTVPLTFDHYFIPGETVETNEVIIVKGENGLFEGKSPLIVMPHGGPHSANTTDFNSTYAFANLSALIGQIGTLDIHDVHSAAVWAKATQGVDQENVYLFGGSHGGFISAHLVTRYPDFYKASCMRNPVVNVGAMVSNSDIPDWCFAEAALPFDPRSMDPLSPEHYKIMYEASPVSHLKDKVSPVLMMLGEGDRRVPPSQGLRFVETLKGKGFDAHTLMFPKVGHALDTFEAQRYGFEACVAFYLKYYSP